MADDPLHCSFCAKRSSEVEMLLAGPAVFICSECIEMSMDVLIDERARLRRLKAAGEREYASWFGDNG